VKGNLAEPASFAWALEGVTGLHLINFDQSNGGYDLLQSGEQIVELAQKAGVQRVTVLRGGEKSSIEKAIEASDLGWTYIQPVEFMSNMLEWADGIRDEGIVRVPFGNRRTAIVHEADIAAVTAIALTEEDHAGKCYTITGPEVLTPRKLLCLIGEAIGRNLNFVELSEEEARKGWQEAGFPDEVIEFFVWAHGNTPAIGYTVRPTVEELTGRPARTFAQWASEHAADFRA
jgi:uncharacterized protein YbjT (DUF2867 family)